MFHKKLKKQRKMWEDGGVMQQQNREAAERVAQYAAQSGDKYDELLAQGTRYAAQQDTRRAARACREAIALRPDVAIRAIALRPDGPVAYLALGCMLSDTGLLVEAAQRFLEAKERFPVGSGPWADAIACAFDILRLEECAELTKPEWWNDEELKALSARVVRARPNDEGVNLMRAAVLRGVSFRSWEAGPRSAAELEKAATHYERAAVLCNAPALKAESVRFAEVCRSHAGAM